MAGLLPLLALLAPLLAAVDVSTDEPQPPLPEAELLAKQKAELEPKAEVLPKAKVEPEHQVASAPPAQEPFEPVAWAQKAVTAFVPEQVPLAQLLPRQQLQHPPVALEAPALELQPH